MRNIDSSASTHAFAFSRQRTVQIASKAAALGGDPAEVSLALRMALSLEGVECRPQ
jgi:hypothetical protein